jgi:hypothetical protein
VFLEGGKGFEEKSKKKNEKGGYNTLHNNKLTKRKMKEMKRMAD